MKYTVVYVPEAEQQLAAIWNSSQQQAEVSRAANEIDRLLAYHAPSEGEARSGDVRLLIVPPLAVLYRIHPDDCIVRVAEVWEMH